MRGSRIILIIVGILGVLAGLGVAGEEVVRKLIDAMEVVMGAPGGPYHGAALGLGLAILIWSLFAPKAASGIAATVPGAALVVALGYAFAWRTSAVGPTLEGRASEVSVGFTFVISAAVIGLAAAAMAAAWVSLTLALRARAEAHDVAMTLRAGMIPLVAPIALVMLVSRLDPSQRFGALGVLPVVVCILAATALATVGRGPEEEGAAREAWASTAFAVLSVVFVGLTVALANIDSRAEAWRAPWASVLRALVPLAAPTVAFAAVIFVLFAVATPLRLRALPRAAQIIRGPVGGAALAAGVLVWTTHAAGKAVAHVVDDIALPPLGAAMVDEEPCGEARLDTFVSVSGGSARLPGGAAMSDPGVARASLDAIEQDEDLWIASAPDTTPFRPLGELMRAAAAKRGPRGATVVYGAESPPLGCAVRFLGKASSGKIACTEPIALDVAGCVPERTGPGEGPLHITLRDDGWVELSLAAPVMNEKVLSGDLEDAIRRIHAKYGQHVDASDTVRDVAIVTVPPDASLANVMSTLESVRKVRRDLRRAWTLLWVPAYVIALGMARAPSP